MATRSKSTERLYSRAQEDFVIWCQLHNITHPTPADIANHLRFCAQAYGPSTPGVRLSAIGKMYRDQGYPFDTRVEPIQSVMRQLRAATKRKETRS